MDRELPNTPGKFAVAILSLLLLAGCGRELEKAESVSPRGSDFSKHLYRGYVDLSFVEYGEADYQDSDVFAERAIAAASGAVPAPESLDARRIPAAEQTALAEARARLVAVLDEGADEILPYEAAQAQVSFDCWMQEQEENLQPKDVEACRGGFVSAMAYVEEQLATAKLAAAEPAPRPAPQPAKVESAEALPALTAPPKLTTTSRSYVIYFDFDQNRLSPDAVSVLDDIVKTVLENDYKNVQVGGHSDLAGSEAYNEALSLKRAATVIEFLVDSGLGKDKILSAGYGSEVPAIYTPKPEAKNRRVEIVLTR